MLSKTLTVLELLDLDLTEHDSLHLHCVCGQGGLTRSITIADLNRPGLALSGFFDSFAYQRVQLFGRGECAYLQKLIEDRRTDTIKAIMKYDIPCCIFSHNIPPMPLFLELAQEMNCPVLQTDLSSTELSIRLMRVLSNVFAPAMTMHGVLVEVYGIGILILGDSGVGKSETALALIERGHRLVADDVVEITCINGNTLMGRGANKIIGHHMEIRGLGIINIMQLYGVRSVREQKQIQLVAKLEEWDSHKVYDRIGTNELTLELLDVKIPLLEIPVKSGRHIPIILETAAMNERLKSMGYFSAKDFNQNILRWMESSSSRVPYYSADDTY
nr:HPr(Ser) kinase/phosphatase [uncultured Treponema sp.]